MIKIRLSRSGSIGKPFYKIVVIESRKKQGGEPIEVIGFINPVKKDKKIEEKRMEYWISKGAQVSPSVQKLLKNG